jgi:hydroxymethylglutaryl-CoA reductase
MSYRSISFRNRILEKLRKILTEDELSLLTHGGLNIELADQLRENVIGTTQIPLCIADGFRINGNELLIPLATEERTIVLQAERGAKLVNEGFHAESSEQIMIGQIQVVNIPDLDLAEKRILSEKFRRCRIHILDSKTSRSDRSSHRDTSRTNAYCGALC